MQSGKVRKQGLGGKRHAGHLPAHAARVVSGTEIGWRVSSAGDADSCAGAECIV